MLGEHTEEICRDVLMMSDEEIRQLVAEDILHTPANTQGTGKSMFG